jgi:response regulator RpfG family c-di-GMP phosphodiesterase
MNEKVLCVDDDPNVVAGFQRNLRRRFTIDTALNGNDCLRMVETKGPYAVVVADMNMPGINGVELLARLHQLAPDTIRIMLTGNADQHTAMEAVNHGQIFRFLTKPCTTDALGQALEAGIKQYRLVTAEKELLEKTLGGSIQVLTEILSLVEPQFFGRAQMLRDYMRLLAPALKIEEVWELEAAAMLAQIGFVTIPAEIIQKERQGTPLSETEKVMLGRVQEISSKLLEKIPRLEGVSKIIRYQNKNYDGTGAPYDPVSGDALPIAARMLRMLSDFVKKEIQGTPRSEILQELRGRKGAYDPKVLDAAAATLLNDNSPATKTGQSVLAKDLCVGQVLLSGLMTNDDVLIVPAGTVISESLLEKVENFSALAGIKEPIYVKK